MDREFYHVYEPSPYSFELYDAYYDILTQGYLSFEAANNPTTIDTLKSILILFITFPKKALTAKKRYEKLEEMVKNMRNEDDFKKTAIEIFDALDEIGLFIDLYKETFVGENQSNTKMVMILRGVGTNIINGYEQTARRLMFMFYLSFRHKLDDDIDETFFSKNITTYDMNRNLMSKADEIGLFMSRVPMISDGMTRGM
jgi:hypothetical protein